MKLLRLTSLHTGRSVAVNPMLIVSISSMENTSTGTLIEFMGDCCQPVSEDYQTVAGMWDVGMERANVALKW